MDRSNFDRKVKEVFEISTELNKVLDGYYKLTMNIKALLSDMEGHENDGNESSIETILKSLDQRDGIINQYNKQKNDYDELLTSFQTAEVKDLKELEEARMIILQSIDKIDSENRFRINHMFIKHQAEIKKINEGKRMHNAYEGKHPLAYGVFIDKKK